MGLLSLNQKLKRSIHYSAYNAWMPGGSLYTQLTGTRTRPCATTLAHKSDGGWRMTMFLQIWYHQEFLKMNPPKYFRILSSAFYKVMDVSFKMTIHQITFPDCSKTLLEWEPNCRLLESHEYFEDNGHEYFLYPTNLQGTCIRAICQTMQNVFEVYSSNAIRWIVISKDMSFSILRSAIF